ncbi:MAG: ADP-forming succinate--CoA ligase subunit beta [Flavobacteriales bacterium]|nr:ADP-forming succinate--CoA ligase subunit beta [Flavobacteriales bacterium]MCX7649466.1 ADP-forming succinate--CoA ligase subunit beta [Flavobacteriales bacterium]MDW8431829.1 ADP-forming succinate--CoA ligase subunit beta [Flavobacteriales bacterium]
MNLHEYQGKSLLSGFGVRVQRGYVAETPEQAVEAARRLQAETQTPVWVVKAQIHAGGRGKGKIEGTEQRGVALAKTLEDVQRIAGAMLGRKLVTLQTGPEGKTVHKVFVAEDAYLPGPEEPKEFYISILLDRQRSRNVIVYSPEGGVNIEEVAEKTPHLIFREFVDPSVGLQAYQCRRIAFNLGLSGTAFKNMTVFIKSLYEAYIGTDAALFEINPALKAADGSIIAVDAKVSIDDNALERRPEIASMRDILEEDPMEVEAGQFNLNFIKLDGNVGCMVNGAGLAMATMDMIKLSGGEPANFLDVGGTADARRVENAFRIILKDPHVKAILVNIFGGIVRCDRVAQGIVDAYRNIGSIHVPIIVRLQGTNAEEAKKILEESGLQVLAATELEEAALKVQEVLA